MSIHSSLKTKGKLMRSRNVWNRQERLQALEKLGRWQEGESILGLPKVRTIFKVKTKKKVKEEAAVKKGETQTETPAAK